MTKSVLVKKIGYGIFLTDFTKIGYDFGYGIPLVKTQILVQKNLNFSAWQLNFDWFENALKLEFLVYAITL